MTCYVITRQFGGSVAHEGDRQSCLEYIATCGQLHGQPGTNFVIAEGAVSRKAALVLIRRQEMAR